MERILIKDKLQRIEYPFDQISLGDFDYIGEFTAKKTRGKEDPLFRSVGAFFRPNYERGILAYALIKRFEIRSVFEIGFGRGYFAFCAAKAMCDMGFDDGQVVSVDPNIDEKHVQNLAQVFPREWFCKLNVQKLLSLIGLVLRIASTSLSSLMITGRSMIRRILRSDRLLMRSIAQKSSLLPTAGFSWMIGTIQMNRSITVR